MGNKNAKTWQYETRKEQAASAAITLATGTAYVWCLSQVFNPIALGVAATYTGYKLTKDFLLPALSDKYRKKLVNDNLKKEHYLPAHNEKNIESIVAELSRDMGLSYTPSVYFYGDKAMPDHMDFCERLLYDLQRSDRQKELRQDHKDNFWADGTDRTILTTPKALENVNDQELRAVLGHEVAHLKAHDSYSSQIMGTDAINLTNRALFYTSILVEPYLLALPLTHLILKRTKKLWKKTSKEQNELLKAKDQQLAEQYGEGFFKKMASTDLDESQNNKKEELKESEKLSAKDKITIAALFSPILYITSSLLLIWVETYPATALLLASLTALPKAAKTNLLCLSRHFEQRADRNGLYHTRNLKGSIGRYEKSREKTPISKLLSSPSTHPENFERVEMLKSAWKKIKDFPPPAVKAPPSPTSLTPTAKRRYPLP